MKESDTSELHEEEIKMGLGPECDNPDESDFNYLTYLSVIIEERGWLEVRSYSWKYIQNRFQKMKEEFNFNFPQGGPGENRKALTILMTKHGCCHCFNLLRNLTLIQWFSKPLKVLGVLCNRTPLYLRFFLTAPLNSNIVSNNCKLNMTCNNFNQTNPFRDMCQSQFPV